MTIQDAVQPRGTPAFFKVGAAELLARHASRSGAPTAVIFQVTDRCNYDCVHCYQEHGDKDELSFDDIARILAEIADAGVLFLTLMGGEFFVRRDADDILREARRLGFAVKLLTTGHHITEQRADLIASLKPIQIDLSVYGAHAEVHDAITDQPGSWLRTLAAARRLTKRGVIVALKSPVMSVNARDLPALAALAEEIGAEYSFDPMVTPREDGDLGPTRLRASTDELRGFYRNDAAGVWQALRAKIAQLPSFGGPPTSSTPCRAGQQVVGINAQGEVWPCNSLPVKVGDLRTQSFRDVWFASSELARVRKLTWDDIEECRACELRAFCSRCHAVAMLDDGKLTGPSLEACRQAVLVRDMLREDGVVPADHDALPPTWERVQKRYYSETRGVRSTALRVLP